jgi:CubicO group peptidase (beta-lactamase class C family)
MWAPMALVLCVVAAGCAGSPDAGSSSGGTRATSAVPAVVSPALTDRLSKGLADQLALGPQIGVDFDAVRAIRVTVNGQVAFEKYYGSSAQESRDVMSVTKSVMSTLVGIAVRDRKLHLDDPLSTLLPQYAGAMSPTVAAQTLRDILTMSAGLTDEFTTAGPTFMRKGDWTRAVLAAPSRPSGTFAYSNGGAHLLSAILEQATDRPVLEYARAELFEPLGIDTTNADTGLAAYPNSEAYLKADFAWPSDPQGRPTGWALLKLRPADMSLLGQLYLDGGAWGGRQILPADWVRTATTRQVDNPDGGGYGFMWWIVSAADEPAYAAIGYGGQLIEVVPSLGLVVVVSTEVVYDGFILEPVDPQLLVGMVDSVIAPAVRDAR